MLIAGWNRAGWMEMPRRVGDRVGRLIGAEPGTVVMGDTLSIKVYQALAAALELNPARRVILSDTGNFLSDLYIADGLVRALGRGYELRTVPPEEVEANIDETVAATLITEIDYRTGCKHDMKWLTEMAHAVGAVAIWDLAHSAGAPPVQLAKCRADFAVGCTYKYLNSGPVGSPPILQLAALDAAMDVSDLTTMEISVPDRSSSPKHSSPRSPPPAPASPSPPPLPGGPWQPGQLPPPRRPCDHARADCPRRDRRFPRPRLPPLRIHAALHRALKGREGRGNPRRDHAKSLWDRPELKARARHLTAHA